MYRPALGRTDPHWDAQIRIEMNSMKPRRQKRPPRLHLEFCLIAGTAASCFRERKVVYMYAGDDSAAAGQGQYWSGCMKDPGAGDDECNGGYADGKDHVMRIITISRQFGSGGRELGERLATQLGWDYYDKEIIESLAQKHDLDEEFVRDVLSRHGWHHIQLTYRHSFSQLMVNPSMHTSVLLRQSEIIKEIAQAGNDCVIVGRDADVILLQSTVLSVLDLCGYGVAPGAVHEL